MSMSGLEVWDKSLQTSNIWLNEICDRIGPDKQLAWKVLSTVLHKLRDRLPVELAAHLGTQLPLIVRGVYYDQYRPAAQPMDWRTANEFVREVENWLSDVRPVDPNDAIAAVFTVLTRHIAPGEIEKIRQALPHQIRDQLWPTTLVTAEV